MTTKLLLTIGLLAILTGCGALLALLDSALTVAYNDALRRIETPANETAQKVTAVCVGLNVGSCRTNQDSASTSTPAAGGYPGANPWPVILLATGIVSAVFLTAMLRWYGGEATR